MRAYRSTVFVTMIAASFLFLGPVAPHAIAVDTSETIVSLTFDDGSVSQYAARPILEKYGMHATFFIISGLVGSDDWFMTWSQIRGLLSDGNEIGGHTLDHVNLTKQTPEEQRRQVCEDRSNLMKHGFHPISFAYPEAAYDEEVEQVVQACGYTSARTVDGLGPPAPYAEHIPPNDPYATRAGAVEGGAPMSLDDLKKFVTEAEENGGGWVQITFHEVCDSCTTGGRVTPATLDAFLDWLTPRSSRGTHVKTIGEVVPGSSCAAPKDA